MFKVFASYIRHAEKITQQQADKDLTSEHWSPEVSELDKSSSSPSPTTALRRFQRQRRLHAKLTCAIELDNQGIQLNFVTIKHVPAHRF